MNSCKAYDKLIDKITNNLIDLRKEIDSLPDVKICNLPLIIFKSSVFSSRITELYDKLNQLRGKVKSALDTYTRAAAKEEDIETQVNPGDKVSANKGYLSKLMRLLEDIALLEDSLRRKSLQEFLGNTTKNEYRQKANSENEYDIDWEELNLKL